MRGLLGVIFFFAFNGPFAGEPAPLSHWKGRPPSTVNCAAEAAQAISGYWAFVDGGCNADRPLTPSEVRAVPHHPNTFVWRGVCGEDQDRFVASAKDSDCSAFNIR